MRVEEIRDAIQLRRPQLGRVARVLSRCVTIEDLQREASRRWPKGVRGYVDGGADAEVSLARNRAAFDAYDFVPNVLRDVSAADPKTTILGNPAVLPLVLAPTGYTRMVHTDGELAAAAAARRAGVPYTLATMSTTSIEDVGAVGGDLWFQLYVWRDRGLTNELVARARDSGYRVLLVTVDTPVAGLRTRDHRSGFTMPPRLAWSTLADMARHPAWCSAMLRGKAVTFANLAPALNAQSLDVMSFIAEQFEPALRWQDIEVLRERWSGPLVLKGLATPEDVDQARRLGVDAVILSNHGGRQLDKSRPPIEAVGPVREVVGEEIGVLVDSGIRRGSDIAVAIARGADACCIGRPYLYGLGAAGEEGCRAAIAMLAEGLRRTMQLLGVTTVPELRKCGPELIRPRTGSVDWPRQ